MRVESANRSYILPEEEEQLSCEDTTGNLKTPSDHTQLCTALRGPSPSLIVVSCGWITRISGPTLRGSFRTAVKVATGWPGSCGPPASTSSSASPPRLAVKSAINAQGLSATYTLPSKHPQSTDFLLSDTHFYKGIQCCHQFLLTELKTSPMPLIQCDILLPQRD